MNDAEILDNIAARLREAIEEQVALFKRSQPDYTVDNEDLLGRFMDAVESLLKQRDDRRKSRKGSSMDNQVDVVAGAIRAKRDLDEDERALYLDPQLLQDTLAGINDAAEGRVKPLDWVLDGPEESGG